MKTLMENVLDESFECRTFPLANSSTAMNVLKVLRSFLHRSHGAFGPLVDHQLVIFLDNIGSVKPEIYGSQPPLELIRQFFDYGGWYDTLCVEFQKIFGTTILAAMGPAGSGLFSIPERLLGHFYYLHIPKLQESSLNRIFEGLLQEKLAKHHESIRALIPSTADASIAVYDQCSKNLLPVPSKMHYIFSLRNLVRVLKGILLVDAKYVEDEKQFVRLWYHEMMREFFDRFNQASDRDWFSQALRTILIQKFKLKFEMISQRPTISFNDFVDRAGTYRECRMTPDETMKCCTQTLEDYN